SRCKLASIPQTSRAGREEIRIQRDDYFGRQETVVLIDRLPERLSRAGARAVRPSRIPLIYLGRGKQFLHCGQLIAQRGRRQSFGKNANARPVLALLRIQRFLEDAEKRPPGTNFALKRQRLGSIRIVELQNR